MDRLASRAGRRAPLRLVFIYNAEAGLAHGLVDSLHKLVSPRTYSCGLCAITHGFATMRPAWRDWLAKLDIPAEFFHRADFAAAWPGVEIALPAILIERRGMLEPIVSAAEFGEIDTVDALIAVLENRLAQFPQKCEAVLRQEMPHQMESGPFPGPAGDPTRLGNGLAKADHDDSTL